MAQTSTGFPWHNLPENRGSESLSEKLTNTWRRGSDPVDNVADVTNSRTSIMRSPEKQKLNGKSKKRSGSLRHHHNPRIQFKPQVEQRTYNVERHYNIRTIPPWVQDADEDDLAEIAGKEDLESPHAALVAQHNSSPSAPSRGRTQADDEHLMSSGATRSEKTSRWVTFARSSAYPREQFDNEKVDMEWFNENFTDYSRPWLAGPDGEDPEEGDARYRSFQRKRQVWYKRAQFTIFRNPFVPLAFRATILLFAACATALGASIFHEANKLEACLAEPAGTRDPGCDSRVGQGNVNYHRDPSALMAIIVDVISIVYTIGITYDEYRSKPLGLRKARSKVRLVLLDLFFIVFQSANLSLAFESLTVDEGACYVGSVPETSYRFDRICGRAQALSAVLLVSLLAWLLTFSVSVFRLVERINTR